MMVLWSYAKHRVAGSLFCAFKSAFDLYNELQSFFGAFDWDESAGNDCMVCLAKLSATLI